MIRHRRDGWEEKRGRRSLGLDIDIPFTFCAIISYYIYIAILAFDSLFIFKFRFFLCSIGFM